MVIAAFRRFIGYGTMSLVLLFEFSQYWKFIGDVLRGIVS
jgi:hypothetical protein